jgi:hypothetical protein
MEEHMDSETTKQQKEQLLDQIKAAVDYLETNGSERIYIMDLKQASWALNKMRRD